MEGLLVAALFWEQVTTTPPANVRQNPSPISITKEVEQKEPNYFSIPKTQKDKNRAFFESLSFKKEAPLAQKNLDLKPKTTVIFAPHPDDEILCCSALIAGKLNNHENVKVIYTTNGDALKDGGYQQARDYGKRRQRESREATAALGLEKSDLFFLGFPDGQLQKLDQEGSVRSIFTDQNKSLGGEAFPYSPYTRQRLKQNFNELFKRWNVTEVYIPSLKDYHPDHQVTAKLVREVILEKKIYPKIFTYLVHGSIFSAADEDKINHEKLKLIRVFSSQFWTPHHEKFMEQFAKIQEQFEQLMD